MPTLRSTPGRGAAQLRAALRELASLHGIQASYTGADGRRRFGSSSSILAVLRALGSPVEGMADIPDALRARRDQLAHRLVEPVLVAWDGRLDRGSPLQPPPLVAGEAVRISIELEGQEEREVGATGLGLPGFGLPDPLPPGYHRARVRSAGREATALIISAPRRRARGPLAWWGVSMPLYALHSSRSWGIGDLADLGQLLEWVGRQGGDLVATLPLLASFLGERPFEPSPYSPASRLFWNEVFLDVESIPEAQASPEARELLRSGRLRRELERLRREPLVDYRAVMTAKRGVLEAMARHLFADAGSPRARRLRAWSRSDPAAADYAAFRAATERHGRSWWEWPQAERDGRLPRAGGDPDRWRYHLYVQRAMAEQMEELGRRAGKPGSGMYFDVPLGVHPDSYDVWRERDAFVLGVSAGSPPDPFFTGGQNWGFPPLHPDRIREQGYRYPIACLRHLLRHAAVLRMDHVMGLHRLFVIPHGLESRRGLYVRYRSEEWYAIISLEAQRNGTVIVGEDLGTVPAEVRRAMARHHVYRSFVVQYEARPDRNHPLPDPAAESLATVETHDMPPFAAFWRGLDIPMRVERGWLCEAEARREARQRDRLRGAIVRFLAGEGWLPPRVLGRDAASRRLERAVLEGLLRWLAAGPAGIVLINLEDLWGETRPQNVPGTTTENPNWRRRARLPVDAFRVDPRVMGTLGEVDRMRAGGLPR